MKKSKQPIYKVIVNDMIKNIEDGKWEKGKSIPPINDLVNMYPASRMTVLKAMHLLEEEGYVTVEYGRGTIVRNELPGKRIGILYGANIFSVPPPLFSLAICNGLSEMLIEKFYHPKFYMIQENMKNGTTYPNPSLALDIKRQNLKGLILVSTNPLPALCKELMDKKLPIVDMGGNKDLKYHIDINNDHFISESISFISSKEIRSAAFMTGSREMFKKFSDGCAENNIKCIWKETSGNDSTIVSFRSLIPEEDGYNYFNTLWDAYSEKPQVLLISDDIMAKGAAQAISARGIKVPEDLIVISSTNSGIPLFYPIPIITYEFDTNKIISTACKLLFDQIAGKNPKSPAPIRGKFKQT